MLEKMYYNVTYKGFNITDGMEIPLVCNKKYNIRLRQCVKPDVTNKQLSTVELMAFVYDTKTNRCVACLPYKIYEWNIERYEDIFRV